MPKLYQIIVSNIGNVNTTTDRKFAHELFREYREQSKNNYGRGAGETVTMLIDGIKHKEYQPLVKLPLIKDIRALLVDLKSTIGDDYRVDDDDTVPIMQVTIGANDQGEWNYQTGDNSYTGGAYSYPHWGICYLTRRSNSTELARDIVDQIAGLIS